MNKKIGIGSLITIILGGVLISLNEILRDPTLTEQLINECEEERTAQTLTPQKAYSCKQIKNADGFNELSDELKTKADSNNLLITDGEYVLFYSNEEFAQKKDYLRGKFNNKNLEVSADEMMETYGVLALEANSLKESNPDCMNSVIKASTRKDIYYNVLNNDC